MPALPLESDLIGSPNQTFADGLRRLADWLDTHPAPRVSYIDPVYIFAGDSAEFARFASSLGGFRTKGGSEMMRWVERDFGDSVRLRISILREYDSVCEKVQTGTRQVQRPVTTETVDEPVYGWVCSDRVLP